jgi:hypothetical protein
MSARIRWGVKARGRLRAVQAGVTGGKPLSRHGVGFGPPEGERRRPATSPTLVGRAGLALRRLRLL